MVLKATPIAIFILIFIQSCNFDNVRSEYPSQRNSYQKKSIGKFFKKDLAFRNKKNHKHQQLSRHEFWQNLKNKIIEEGFEIDFKDDELFFITTEWYNHDQQNQIKINILLKSGYTSHIKNLSINVSTRVKNSKDEWVLYEKKYLKDLYLNKIKHLK
jgi:isochorismate synthase EntC